MKRSSRQKTVRKKTQKKLIAIPAVTYQVQKPTGMDRPLHIFLHTIFLICSFLFTLLLGAAMMLILIGFLFMTLYTRVIAQNAGHDPLQLVRTIAQSRLQLPIQSDGRENILVLGTDILGNRDSEQVRTDTMMIASIGLDRGDVKLISFPRDLWIASQSAKINALYEKELTTKTSIVSVVLGDISGLPIHHTIIVDIETMANIVDAFGGLDITVERSFVDNQFPRTDVDVRKERDPRKLYETVAFTKGVEHMTGDRILQFIRSRHSTDPIEGSDDGRVHRQQLVIATLLAKLKDPMLARQPEVLGRLYKLYEEKFSSELPVTEISALFWQLLRHHATPQIHSYQFPIQGSSNDPLIYHPEHFASGAWVYEPIDPTWKEVRSRIQQWIEE